MSAPRPEPRPARFTPATVAGCYDLSYARWWFMGPVHAEDPAAVLPRRVQLDTTPMLYRSRFRVIKPAPSMTQLAARDARAAWEMIGDDSLGITWKESAGDVTLRVAIEADSLRGLARSVGESPDPFQQPRAVVVGTRVPCASDQRPPRAVIATADDSLVARREAQVDADRIRRGMTIINAQHLHEMISRFRLVRGRVPDKLEDLMTVEYTRYPRPDGMWLMDGWGRPFTIFVGPKVYELRSVGADGKLGTEDDVVSKRASP